MRRRMVRESPAKAPSARNHAGLPKQSKTRSRAGRRQEAR